ncbi:ABC transporter permease [Microbulbifer epialgicus]|uniref:ABC transporter permease n=1 Tax=Microbulbifer epialgicus TaxID=393907 RepID=A0ABV4P4F8_9GAMM
MINDFISAMLTSHSRTKLISSLNIIGLTFSLSAFVLISIYIRDELNYDKWIENVDLLYKFEATFEVPGRDTSESTMSPFSSGPALMEELPYFESVTRVLPLYVPIKIDDRVFNERVMFVDPNFFNTFNIESILGVREEALYNNNKLLISRKYAEKYFGTDSLLDENIIGKVLTFGISENNSDPVDYEIAGILENTPRLTHFSADMVALLDSSRREYDMHRDNYAGSYIHTYVTMKEGVNVEALDKELSDFSERHTSDRLKSLNIKATYNLFPVSEIYLHNKKSDHLDENGSVLFVWVLSIASVLILILAGVNFSGLSLAQAQQRSREICLRKLAGASYWNIRIQFLGESLIVSIVSLILAYIFIFYSLPWFNYALGKNLEFNFSRDIHLNIYIILFALFMGLIYGLYPAFITSSYRPSVILRSSHESDIFTSWKNYALLVFQFGVSISLVSMAILVLCQLDYTRRINLGFDPSNIVAYKIDGEGKQDELRYVLSKISGVNSVGFMQQLIPMKGSVSTAPIDFKNSDDTIQINSEYNRVDSKFFEIFGIKPLVGRVFSEDYISDKLIFSETGENPRAGVVINKTFSKRMGFDRYEDALGETLFLGQIKGKIIGIIDDIHTRPVTEPVQAFTFLYTRDEPLRVMVVKVNEVDFENSLLEIENTIKNIYPNMFVETLHIDKEYESIYIKQERQSYILLLFTFLAVIISFLGLYCTSAFASIKKGKEVALRKLYGANRIQITMYFLFKFASPIIIAGLVSMPIVIFFFNWWLSSFIKRISLVEYSYIYILVVLAYVATSWMTLCSQIIGLSRLKPVDALRHI